jgi:tRNA dimethylallyltransferase
MFADGLIEEVRNLMKAAEPLGPVPAQSVGYREAIEFLSGRTTIQDTVTRIEQRTRRFAKHQATWFRGLAEVSLFPVEQDEVPEDTAGRLAAKIMLAN